MKSNTNQIDEALAVALRKLITQISRNGELTNFSNTFQTRRQYDQLERQYIENQRLRNELGNEYQSSDSEQQRDPSFNKLSKQELIKLIRKNLIEKHFDEGVLQPLQDKQHNEREVEESVKLIADQALSNHQELNDRTELNIIQEAKQIVEEDIEKEKESYFALSFLIKELERIDREGLSTNKLKLDNITSI